MTGWPLGMIEEINRLMVELRRPAPPRARICVVDAAPSCKAILSAWGDELSAVSFNWPGPYDGPMRRAMRRHRIAIETAFLFGRAASSPLAQMKISGLTA